MERHQRIQLKTTSRSTNQPFKASSFQTDGFGVQQKAASTPASKAELWENYQRASQIAQQRVGQTRSAIQTKLTIGQPGDKYEQEADSVADRVMAMSEPAQVQREELGEEEEELQMKPLAGTISPLVQREELPEEEEELQMKPEDKIVQREELPEEEELQMKSSDNSIQREELPEEEELQMKQSAPSNQTATPDLESQLSSSKGGGNPLSDDVRSFMEPRFGADFSNVKVHTDGKAVQMARNVGAQAFAYGSDVYFGAGKSPGNNELTAHELTHVVQQTGSGVIQRSLFGSIVGGLGGAVLGVVGGPVSSVVGAIGGAAIGDILTSKSRSLTEQEKAYAKPVYLSSLKYDDITVVKDSALSTGASRTIGNRINFESSLFEEDSMELTHYGREILIHEMGHVWQYQQDGLGYIPLSLISQAKAALAGDRNQAYDWRKAHDASIPWSQWNPEQQAEAIQDYNALLRKTQAQQGTTEDYNTLAILLPYIKKVQAGEGAPTLMP